MEWGWWRQNPGRMSTWRDRCLLRGPRLAVVTSQQGYRAVMRQIEATDADPYCEKDWEACTHAFDVSGELVCVVGLNLPRLTELPPIDAAAVMVHEAVHVWQRTRARLGPGDLGSEMEAYAVQNIAAEVMRAYAEATSSSMVRGASPA
jgi:hypothetical protein